MMEIKDNLDITWHDLPKIESHSFAFRAVKDAILHGQVNDIHGLSNLLFKMHEFRQGAQLNKIERDLETGWLYLVKNDPISPQFQLIEPKESEKQGEVKEVRILEDIFYNEHLVKKLRHPTSLYINSKTAKSAQHQGEINEESNQTESQKSESTKQNDASLDPVPISPLTDEHMLPDPFLEVVYVPSSTDPAIGDGALILLSPEQSRDLAMEEAYWNVLREKLECAINEGDPKRIEHAKEEMAKALDKVVKPSKKSHTFTEIRRLKGSKFTYARSDKLKNHMRKYSLKVDDEERSMFIEKKRKDGTTYKTLNKKVIKERFKVDFKPKLGDDYELYNKTGNLLEVIDEGWAKYIDEVNDSLEGSAQQEGVPEDKVEWRRGWDAQLFRYYVGAKVNWEIKPMDGRVSVGADAQALCTLAQARACL